MKGYAGYSFWLETSGDELTPRPPLEGSVDAEVAVLGAGYTGLWTAYYLLRRDPGLKVIVLEREIAGFGASGRNGGWCIGLFPLSAQMLEQRFGREAASGAFTWDAVIPRPGQYLLRYHVYHGVPWGGLKAAVEALR